MIKKPERSALVGNDDLSRSGMTKTKETAGVSVAPQPDATAGAGGNQSRTPSVAVAAQPAPHFSRESLQWWTPAALAWGTPVKMWATIVATAWRPFLPPTALTHDRQPPSAAPAPTAKNGTSHPAVVPGTRSRRR
jgi:hypothetical protein